MHARLADGDVSGQFLPYLVDLMNLQSAFGVDAALLGSPRSGGNEDVPQSRHQTEGAGVDGFDDADFLLPRFAQPASAEVMFPQSPIEVAPEGDGAVSVALRQGRDADPGFVSFQPAQGFAETILRPRDHILERGTTLGQHADQ